MLIFISNVGEVLGTSLTKQQKLYQIRKNEYTKIKNIEIMTVKVV